MGLLDHRRTWHYEVAAAPDACISAFERAFKGRGGLISKARWQVTRSGNGALAIYGGRKGLGAVGGTLSQTSAHEQDTALGSEVRFEVEPAGNGKSACSMWLAMSGRAGVAGLLGSTADARFIRPYMQAVSAEILNIDPSARTSTT